MLTLSILEIKDLIKARNTEYYKTSKAKIKAKTRTKTKANLDLDSEEEEAEAPRSINRYQALEDFDPDIPEPYQDVVFYHFPFRKTTIQRDPQRPIHLNPETQIYETGTIIEDRDQDKLFWRQSSLSTPPNYDKKSDRYQTLVYPPRPGEFIYNDRFKSLLVQTYQILRAGGF